MGSLSSRYGKVILAVSHCSFGFYTLTRQNRNLSLKLTQRQVDCITLWRKVLYSSFFDYTLLVAPLRTVLFNDNDFSHLAAENSEIQMFSDAASDPSGCVGIVFPQHGWISWTWPGESKVGIATLEFLAHIIAYCFTLFLVPSCKHVHLWVDNQNAIAWSSGRIRTESNFAVNLTVFNSFLQSACPNCTQTRSFIPTYQNVLADAASRQKFQILGNLKRYALTKPFINFLLTLSKLHPTDQLEIVLTSPTVPLSKSFYSFSMSTDHP